MTTAFETFVNDELPNRVASQEASNTADYFPRYTGTAKLTTERSPAQVLSDIGAQASDADLTAIAALSAAEGFLRKTAADTWTVHKSNLSASAAPGVADDSAAGYSVGSIWIDIVANKSYICVDATVSAAVWNDLTAGGGGGDTHPIADSTAIVKDPADATKLVRVDAGNVTTGTTRVLTMKNADLDLANVLLNILEDTTPQLGGNLDINGKAIAVNAAGAAQIVDENGDEILVFRRNGATAVDYLKLYNANAAGDPEIECAGDSADINLLLNPKGAGSVIFGVTASARLPSGTTAQRPGTPAIGDIRHNSTTGKIEGYESGAWGNMIGGGGGTSGEFHRVLFAQADDFAVNTF